MSHYVPIHVKVPGGLDDELDLRPCDARLLIKRLERALSRWEEKGRPGTPFKNAGRGKVARARSAEHAS
jgi:hypothetical protein